MKKEHILLCLLAIHCLCSCNEKYPVYILDIENLVEKNPDSALVVLGSMEAQIQREPLSTRMYYNLLLLEVSDKCDILHTCDTLLPDIIRYYEERKENDKLMKAYYLMGKQHLELKEGNVPTALFYFFRALDKSTEAKNNAFIGRIHAQMSKSFMYLNLSKEAIQELKTAYFYFQLENDKQSSIDVLCDLASVYNLQSQTDSALYYYQKAYEKAEFCGDTKDKKMDVLQNIANVYVKTDNNDKAHDILEKITKETKEGDKLNYNILGSLFLQTGQKDSAVVCFKRELENESWSGKKYAYWNLYQIEKNNNGFKQALIYLEKYAEYSDSIYTKSNVKSLQKIKILYDLHHIEKEKEDLHQENEEQRVWIICIMVTMAMVIGVAIQYSRVKKETIRKQKEMLQAIQEGQYRKSRRYIDDNKKIIKELAEKIGSIQQEKDALHKELLLIQKEKLEQTNKAIETSQKQQVLLEETLRKSDIYAYCYQAIGNPSITLTGTDWEKLEQVVNDAYDSFTNRLFVLHPSITAMELHICLLLKIQLPTSAISQLVCRTQSAISMSRKQLYKKIFHEEGTPAKLDEFIHAF